MPPTSAIEPPAGSTTEPALAATASTGGQSLPERIIRPTRGWIAIDWRELYQSRELFDTLIARDVKIRYKQTVLGVAWAVLQPLVTMTVFTVIFGRFPGVKPVGPPYPLFLLAGLVPWTFFTNAVTNSGTSLLAQQQLLTKIYFPRLFVPASSVGAYLIDLAIGLGVFGLLMPWFGVSPHLNLIGLPLVILLTFASAFGLGLILASMTVLFRDLRFIIPFAMQLLLFASPIFYSPTILSDQQRAFLAFNPLTGIMSGFRWCLLGEPLDVMALAISSVVTAGLLAFGLFFFRKTERFFADLL